jgi:hypothetical protein
MSATKGVLTGFTYHSYPDKDDSRSETDLISAAWLRNNLLLNDAHANSSICIAQWNALARSAGVRLYLTETNSGYQGSIPPFFLNGQVQKPWGSVHPRCIHKTDPAFPHIGS